MQSRSYLAISGIIFGLVAIFHLLRLLKGWDLVLGTWSAPMLVSWLGVIFPAFLCGWALVLLKKQGHNVL